MRYLARIFVFVYSCTFAVLTSADELPTSQDHLPVDVRSRVIVRGGPAHPAKAAGDTCVLIGPASLNPVAIGTFEDAGGDPDWNGWTTIDWTVPDQTAADWHASTYLAISGARSAYCGDETIPSCGGGDPVGGYDNAWNKLLKWGMTVADPGQPTNLTVSFAFDVDSESGYDYAALARELENEESQTIWQLSGDSTGAISLPVTYAVGEYFGDTLDQVGIWFVGRSDTGWSDGDCGYPSTGLWRLDDVTITCDNPATVVGHDFEDGTLGPFMTTSPGAVGDFVHLGYNLDDPDICVDNHTPQVIFLDDGVVQPATGGSYATSDNRRYADNFVLNYTGGLTFNDTRRLHNAVVSPVIPWQDPTHDGCRLGYGYMTDSFFLATETGMFMEWWIRTTTGDAASIEDAAWQHSPSVYTGGPYYSRRFWDVSDNLHQGRTYVQVALGVREWPTLYGTNGSPSPYYDNVRLETYAYAGPSISTPVYCLPQDAFPEIGDIDTDDLGRNHIRFDQAQNISTRTHEHYHNGDSVVVDVDPLRTGSGLTGRPRFHYKLQRNPLFDPYRTSGLPDSGMIVMDSTFSPTGAVVWNRFNVDLPDTGFIFPGDILRYYFSAEDAIGGAGGTAPFTSTLPADPTGWYDFEDWAWNHEFTMRGLPTLTEDPGSGAYEPPELLVWDDSDSESAGTADTWADFLWWIGHEPGDDFDYYATKGAGVSIGSGLGRRATPAQLRGYENLVYFSGHLSSNTLSNGDWDQGGSNDLALLENWLAQGNKGLFLCGGKLAFDLENSGSAANAFLTDRMSVDFESWSHVDLLGGQLAPRVLVIEPTWVLPLVNSWIMEGGCPTLRSFDLVTATGIGERLALYAGSSGVDVGYPFAAMTLAQHGGGSRVISTPMDLAHIARDPYEADFPGFSSAPVGSRILRSVIQYFGQHAPGPPIDVPVAGVFATTSYPNPFNPVTEIAYSIKAPGHLTLKVFNLRGALVRTLVDGQVEQAGKVAWDGTDSHGGQVASGVYFYEARMGGEVRIGKMALIK